MEKMFYGCTAMMNLDLSSFDTSNVDFFDSMFDGCSSLLSVTINPEIEKNITNFSGVLSGFTLNGDVYTKD